MKNINNSKFKNFTNEEKNEDKLNYNLEGNDNENEKVDESRTALGKRFEVKNLRQIGYGAAGLTIGLIAYLLLSAGAPTANEARSMVSEFTTANHDSEFGYEDVVVDEEYTGDVVPLHPFGSYRVTRAEFDKYERNETVRYGKVNPTFFFDKEPVSQEDTEKQDKPMQQAPLVEIENSNVDITVEDDKASEDNTAIKADSASISLDSGGRGKSVISGFDIHTNKTEDFNVADIREQFAKYAVLPLDAEHFNITSTYGARRDPFTGVRAFHAGVDFSNDGISGSNIYSVIDGEVVESVTNFGKDGLGNYVVIDHGDFHTLYAHMKDGPTLEVGDVVQAGDIVGTVGSTGRSTGPHLHFEVGVGGVKFDGLEFLIHAVDKDNSGM